MNPTKAERREREQYRIPKMRDGRIDVDRRAQDRRVRIDMRRRLDDKYRVE